MATDLITVTFCFDGSFDRLEAYDAIALGLFQDERPLKGTTGFVDWRLRGQLSRLLMGGKLSGNLLESCLIPSQGRVPMDKVFLFGLGALEDLNVNRFTRVSAEVVSTMRRVRSARFVLSAWDLTRGRVEPAEVAGIIYRHLLAEGDPRRLTPSERLITFMERGSWGRTLRESFKQLAERSSELPVQLEVR